MLLNPHLDIIETMNNIVPIHMYVHAIENKTMLTAKVAKVIR